MKQLFPLLWALAALFALNTASAQPVPVIDRAVNDYAHVLTPPEAERLTGELEALVHVTGIQVALVTVYTTAGYPVDDYALATARSWRGGVAGRRAIVALFATQDHRSNLQVGSGLEDQVPDERAAEILLSLRPALRAGHYADAFSQMIRALRESLHPNHVAAPAGHEGGRDGISALGFVGALAALASPFALMGLWTAFSERRRRKQAAKMDRMMVGLRSSVPKNYAEPVYRTPLHVVEPPAPAVRKVSPVSAAPPPVPTRRDRQWVTSTLTVPLPSTPEAKTSVDPETARRAREAAESRRRADEERREEERRADDERAAARRRREEEEAAERRRRRDSGSYSSSWSSSFSDSSSSSSSSTSDWSSSSSDSGSGGFDGGGSSGDW